LSSSRQKNTTSWLNNTRKAARFSGTWATKADLEAWVARKKKHLLDSDKGLGALAQKPVFHAYYNALILVGVEMDQNNVPIVDETENVAV